ncbi:hypothetical protein JHK85_022799 [Glycine max]|nr:hypothetical protein JHK87_022230 [Glycine soja]KAG5016663.1 hypothetical protein JHK85_022799 [Glycine max]
MAYIKPIMQPTYGKDSPTKWTAYWRTSFIAVAELFGYNNDGHPMSGDIWRGATKESIAFVVQLAQAKERPPALIVACED